MKKNMRLLGIALLGLYFIACAFSPERWHFIDAANLVFHEAGHTIFFFTGEFLRILAGSGFQALVPAFLALYFFKSGRGVSGSIVLAWLGQSLANISVYANDAIDMKLDLLGGDSVIHDWNYILSATGYITYAHEIAKVIYVSGIAITLLGFACALWFSLKEVPQKA